LQEKATERKADSMLTIHKERLSQFTLLVKGRSRDMTAIRATMVLLRGQCV
jgi:hypothetical protein